MSKKDLELLRQDGVVMVSRGILTTPLEELTDEEVHFGWSILDLVEKASKGRKEEMRDRLLEVAEQLGAEDEKGSYTYVLGDGGQVKKERRQKKDEVKAGKLRKYLSDCGLDPDVCFKKKTVYEFDREAFEDLLEQGLVDKDEVLALFEPGKVTYALKVTKPHGMPKKLLPEE